MFYSAVAQEYLRGIIYSLAEQFAGTLANGNVHFLSYKLIRLIHFVSKTQAKYASRIIYSRACSFLKTMLRARYY